MTKHVFSGSSSKACKTLNFICYTYNIQNKYIISASCIPKLKDDEDEGDVRTTFYVLICYTCPLHGFCVLYVSMQNGDCEVKKIK